MTSSPNPYTGILVTRDVKTGRAGPVSRYRDELRCRLFRLRIWVHERSLILVKP